MKTVLDCLESGTRYLEEHGVRDARRNMQWLVAKQLACSRLELYLEFDRPLEEADLAPLRDLLRRRGAGEPLQHLLGTVEFCGHEFLSDHRALVPRPETEELVSRILELEFGTPVRVLDMGTGSGVLGLSLAAALGERCAGLTLADVSPAALELARENARRLAPRLACDPQIVEGDLFENLPDRYDLIAANLPYIPTGEFESLPPEVRHDPREALFGGEDGLDVIRRFIPAAARRLAPRGWLAVETGTGQCPAVAAMMEEAGLSHARWSSDLSGNPRFVFARQTPTG